MNGADPRRRWILRVIGFGCEESAARFEVFTERGLRVGFRVDAHDGLSARSPQHQEAVVGEFKTQSIGFVRAASHSDRVHAFRWICTETLVGAIPFGVRAIAVRLHADAPNRASSRATWTSRFSRLVATRLANKQPARMPSLSGLISARAKPPLSSPATSTRPASIAAERCLNPIGCL